MAVAPAGCGGGSAAKPGSTPSQAPAATAPAPAQTAIDRLTLRQQVGQTVILAFAGTTAPDYVLRALRERRVAGVILFAGNVADPGQLRALTASLQRAAGGRALVMLDQEGGDVRIAKFAEPVAGQSSQAEPAAAAAAAAATAHDLTAVGVNVNLAPVADIDRGGALSGRSYPGDAKAVAAATAAAVGAYLAGGVLPTVKHFPGLGGAGQNTDDAPVDVDLKGDDLLPFRAAIGANVPLLMVSHAVYPSLDRARPASRSATILRDLLRGRLGFRGVVITDSLEARAALAGTTVTAAAAASLGAGADLLLLTGDGSFRPVSLALMARATSDHAFRARVRDAASRVLALRARLG
jgi:beta-N-acetylhexosaminidase